MTNMTTEIHNSVDELKKKTDMTKLNQGQEGRDEKSFYKFAETGDGTCTIKN